MKTFAAALRNRHGSRQTRKPHFNELVLWWIEPPPRRRKAPGSNFTVEQRPGFDTHRPHPTT